MGAAFDRPIVWGEEGVFKLRDVRLDEPVPQSMLTENEYALALASGSWVAVHEEWPAERGKVTVVASAKLRDLARELGRPFEEGWTLLGHQKLPARYMSSAEATAWGLEFAEMLVAWADREVGERLWGRRDPCHLHRAEEAYRHVRFLCDRGSAPRLRMYPSLGILLEDLAPSAGLRSWIWPCGRWS